jgi:NADH:ubiquinone oxidoreductase subunit D
MSEMLESLSIANQVVYKMSKYSSKSRKNKKIKIYAAHKILNYVTTKKDKNLANQNEYNTMETLIAHFKYWSTGLKIQSAFTYQSVESPKGEFGVTLIADKSNKPYRCKVRSPAYHSLQAFPILAKGHFLADLITLVGTMDVVFGEIDR